MRYISRFKNSIRASSVYSLAFMLTFVLAAGLTTYEEAAAQPSIKLTVEPPSIDEGNPNNADVTVTATASAGFLLPQMIELTLSGSANMRHADSLGFVATSDYRLDMSDFTTDGKLILMLDLQVDDTGVDNIIGTKVLNIMLNPDNQFEQPETIVVSGSLSGSVVTPATIMVIDDDYDITLAAMVTGDGTISENAANPMTVAVSATLASTRTNPVTVSLNFAGTAASSYYTAAGTHSITIAAGMSTGTANVTIDPEDNTTRGGDKTIIIGGTSSGLNVKPANAVTISDNEQAPTVSISADPSKISEGAGRTTVIMSAKLTGALLEEAAAIKLANITMPDDEMDATGTASADDYDLTGAKSITIPALSESGSTPMSFTPDNDAYFEGDETIIISGSNDDLTVANMPPTLTLTIVDDDFDILLALDNSMVSEDASDAVELEVTATLTGGSRTSDLSVPLAVGTETGYTFQINDTDAADDNIMIKAGERSGTAKVTVTVETSGNDDLYAGNKTVDITVPTSPPDFVLNAKPTTITLVDDEEKPTITLSLDNTSITEGGSSAVQVTANVSGRLAELVTVTLGFGGTAELDEADTGEPAAKDYRLAAASPTLTIQANADASNQVSAGITLTDDGAFEHDETIVISGSASGYEIDPVTVTVVDDDYDIDLSFTDVTINEAVEDAETVAVRATLQSARTNPITITLMFSGTASSSEYVVSGTTTITVPPGPATTTTGMANVTIDPVDNNLRGGNKTIKISGTAEGINVKAADETITIMDDEQAPTVTLKVEPAKLNEDAGTVSVVVTAELSGDGSAPLANAATIELTVDAADVDDSGLMVTEANDNDFSVSGTKSITIPARASSGSTRLSVTVVDDPLFEMEETITVAGKTDAPVANNDGETPPGIASKTISIVDDDFDIKLSVDTSSIAEDASGTTLEPGDPVKVKVTATQSGSRTSDITVMVAYTMDENTVADIVAAAGSITIDAGDMSGEIEVSINPLSLNNDGYEGARPINVGGTSAGYNIQGSTITIADDEEKPTVTLAVDPTSVNEGMEGGTVAVSATLKPNGLSAQTTITLDLSGTAVRVERATDNSNMDAFDKRDYNATIANITVAPNDTDATGGSVMIMARDDDEFEADKTIIVSGKSDDVASVSDATIMLINDDYDVRISLPGTEADRTVMENAADPVTIPVTASLDAAKTSPVTVELRFSGTAMASEYVVGGTTTITLGAGVLTAMANVTIDPVDDELRGGDKTIEVTGIIPGSDLNVQKAANSIKLEDDEEAPTVVISLSPDKLGEDAGAASVTVKAELKDGAPLADTATITVKMDPSDEDGMAGEKDFSVSGSLDIMVPAGIGSASTTVTVNVVDDPTFEGDEAINVTASTDAPVALAVDAANNDEDVQIVAKTLTIVDNDFDVKLTVSPNSVTEGGDDVNEASDATDVTVTATLAGTRTSDVTVNVTYMMDATNIQGGVADGGDMIEISAGDMSGEATVSINTTTLHNETYEGDRTIDVEGTVTNLNVQPATITVADDEVKPTVKLVLADEDKNINENAGSTTIDVTAEISPNGLTESATITLELGGTAAREDDELATGYDDRDYSVMGVGVGEILVSAGETTGDGDVNIVVLDDAVFEETKTIIVSGKSDAYASISSATANLLNNDFDVAIVVPEMSEVPENAEDPVTVEVTANLVAPRSSPITVQLTFGGTADASKYVVSGTTTITLGAGTSTGTASVIFEPVDNDLSGGNKTIEVGGMVAGTDLNVQTSNVTITLVDDEDPASLTLKADPTSIDEGAGSTNVTMTAELNVGMEEAVTIELEVMAAGTNDQNQPIGSSAEGDGEDYSATELMAITIASGSKSSSSSFTLTPVDDNLHEAGDETVVITGSGGGLSGSATIKIADNDYDIRLAADPDEVVEGDDEKDIVITAELAGGARTNDVVVHLGIGADSPITRYTSNISEATLDAQDNTIDALTDNENVLTVSAGATTGMLTITIDPNNDDGAYSGDKNIDIIGRTPEGLNVSGTAVLLRDAQRSMVTITADVDTLMEAGGLATDVMVTAALSIIRPTDTEVTLTKVGMAEKGVDYMVGAPEGGVITIPAGESEATLPLVLTPVDDFEAEGEDGSETILLGGTAGGLRVTGTTIYLIDNNLLPLASVVVDPHTIDEDGEATEVTITVELTGTSNDDIHIGLDKSMGTAKPGDDFTVMAASDDFYIAPRSRIRRRP